MMALLLVLVSGGWLALWLCGHAAEARRRTDRQARATEERRVRECGEVVRYFANHHGHVARLLVDREELRERIGSGISPQELATFLADRCQTIDGPLLGHQVGTDAELSVRLPQALRTRHLYMVGRSGSGKTTLIRNLVLHDLRAGHGLAVLAPEAELIEQEILPFIPVRRIDDVIYINPADTSRPVPLNPLHLEDGEDLDLKVAETLSILRRLFDDDGGGGAPRMETILRQALYALTQVPGSTLLDLEPLLDRQDDTFRRHIVGQLGDDESRQFWTAVYPSYPKDAHLSLLNRMGRLLRPKVVRGLLCAPGSSLDVRRAMDEGKVLLFNLSDGLLGEQNAQILGQLVVAKIQLAAMSRASAPKDERRPFYLYVDEFQAFCGSAGTSYERILSRSRKYGLGLILAHQQTAQIPTGVLSEILGNVSTMLAFNVGAADARRLGRELIGERDGEPVPTAPEQLLSLRVGEAVCKIGRSVMTLKARPAVEDGSEAIRDAVVASSRAKYGVSAAPSTRPTAAAPRPTGSMLDGLDPSEVFGA